MAKVKFYLDTRRGSEPFPIMVVISHRNTSAMMQSGLSATPDEWSAGELVAARSDARKKALESYMASVQAHVESLKRSGSLGHMSAKDIKDTYKADVLGEVRVDKRDLFAARYRAFMGKKTKPKTILIYRNNLDRMRDYDPAIDRRSFDEVNKSYLQDYIVWLDKRGYKATTKSIFLRCIRAVFNDAIDDEITQCYPFRKIMIRSSQTKDRSLTRDELRLLFSTPVADWLREYVDMFKLMFCLRGINIGDMAMLSGTRSGRVEYDRQKTGKHYSIKLEPEAMEVIEKYRGEKYLLNILDRYKSYADYTHHLNDALKKVGMIWQNGKKYTGAPLFPELSSYYARYTWASLAAELDIPRETIAAGLGHSWADVTSVYIRNDMRKKVDEANRKVLDYVFRK